MADNGPNPAPEISVSRSSTSSVDEGAKDHDDTNQDYLQNKSSVRLTHKRRGTPQPWYFGRQTQTWNRRLHGPDLEWHKKWTKDCFTNGRVLIIDYISNHANILSPGSGKPAAAVVQEFDNLKSLKRFYADSKRAHTAALRVIHVQNAATWATDFLLKRYNIDHENETVGMTGFSKWTKFNGPVQRNGKPFPNGKSWRQQRDPWRSVSRTAFGLDYLKVFQTPEANKRRPRNVFGDKPIDAHMMHLNAYSDDRNPNGYDVSVQRISVYVQRNLGPPGQVSTADQSRYPYKRYNEEGRCVKGDEKKVDLKHLDNTSAVIVFETSASLLLEDCLIQPRNEIENRWRRLDLRREEKRDDHRLAAQSTNLIIGDVFHGLAIVWQSFLNVAADHVNILEDKIYEQPADESRAPELWTNQAAWLKVDKVMYMHQDVIREVQGHLRDVAMAEREDDVESRLDEIQWLSNTSAQYERLAHSVQEDLVLPSDRLNDLLYKSVGIRDSRQSLQLGLSMW